jgi:hypothetical protein
MPMTEPEMHGGGDVENHCCCYCCDEAGNLKPREEVRQGMVNFFEREEGKSREEAEAFVDEHMARMPAWRCS